MGSYIIEKAKSGRAGAFFIENAEIRYCWGFILLKIIK